MFGLHIASDIPLPGCVSEASEPDVSIRIGQVPDTLPEPHITGVLYQASINAFLFKREGVAKYIVRNGTEIIVEPARNADHIRLRLFLLSSPLGALFHQRNLLALHGSAIAANGEAIIFVGISGTGKSTLAAAFRQKGYSVLDDDISVVNINKEGLPIVYPGYPQLRIWADAAREMGENPDNLERMLPELEKYFLTLKEGFCHDPLPLKHIYMLQATTTSTFEITPITGMEKLEALNDHTYRSNFLEGLGSKKAHFKNCATVAKQINMSRVSRPAKPFLLNELMQFLEKDFLI